jgi:hypothetical protein
MHGHGVAPEDKLEQAYYQKHPELYKQENLVQLHERKHDFNMSSEDLNRIVRDTANRGSGLGGSFFVVCRGWWSWRRERLERNPAGR